MNQNLIGTHMLLKSWGQWGKGGHLGLPTMSPMFGERALKTPLYGETDPNPELSAIDSVVCRLEPDQRMLLIRKYVSRWPTRQFLKHYAWSFNRFHLNWEKSLWSVRIQIESNPLISVKGHGIQNQTA